MDNKEKNHRLLVLLIILLVLLLILGGVFYYMYSYTNIFNDYLETSEISKTENNNQVIEYEDEDQNKNEASLEKATPGEEDEFKPVPASKTPEGLEGPSNHAEY